MTITELRIGMRVKVWEGDFPPPNAYLFGKVVGIMSLPKREEDVTLLFDDGTLAEGYLPDELSEVTGG